MLNVLDSGLDALDHVVSARNRKAPHSVGTGIEARRALQRQRSHGLALVQIDDHDAALRPIRNQEASAIAGTEHLFINDATIPHSPTVAAATVPSAVTSTDRIAAVLAVTPTASFERIGTSDAHRFVVLRGLVPPVAIAVIAVPVAVPTALGS